MTENQTKIIAGMDIQEDVLKLRIENNKLLDVINNQDVKIADLEKENKTLEGCLLAEQEHTQMLEQQIKEQEVRLIKQSNQNLLDFQKEWQEEHDKQIADLEKENAELKSIAGFQQSSNMKRHFEIQKLEKENAGLKAGKPQWHYLEDGKIPENYKRVLITVLDDEGKRVVVSGMFVTKIVNRKKKTKIIRDWLYDSDDVFITSGSLGECSKPIAWMPFPEPSEER